MKLTTMFSFFKGKSEIEALQIKHKKLLEESFRLSTVSRVQADKKAAEADEVMRRIMDLKAQKA